MAAARRTPRRPRADLQRPVGPRRQHPGGQAVGRRLRVRQEDPPAGHQPGAGVGRRGRQQGVQRHADRERAVQDEGAVGARPEHHAGPQRQLLRHEGPPRRGGHHDPAEPPGAEAEYKGVQSGQFDFARIPPALIPQAKATFEPKGGFIHELTYGINYLLVNMANPPLNNVDARKAISLAIDRDAIIEGVFKGFQTQATSFIPPPLKAYYQAGVCDVCGKPDIARAKELASQGGAHPGHQGQPGLQHRRRPRSLGAGRAAAAAGRTSASWSSCSRARSPSC